MHTTAGRNNDIWTGKVDIWTAIRKLFEDDSQTCRPRLFLCCITGKEMVVVTDGAKERVTKSEEAYINVFVPTICGRCQKRAALPPASLDDIDNENDIPQSVRIKLDDGWIRDWRMFKLAVDFCKEDITFVAKQIVDRKRIMKQLSDHSAQICSTRVIVRPHGEGEMLETVSSFDIGFL